jgi:hypothetical protein
MPVGMLDGVDTVATGSARARCRRVEGARRAP